MRPETARRPRMRELLAGSLAAALMAAPPGQAAEWQVLSLGSGEGCAVAAGVVGRHTGALLLQALATVAPGGGADLILRVPAGAYLPDGIAFRHPQPGGPVTGLVWQRCDARFCTATARLDKEDWGRLLRGREVIVGFRPLADSPVLNLPLGLSGLTAAWRRASTCTD